MEAKVKPSMVQVCRRMLWQCALPAGVAVLYCYWHYKDQPDLKLPAIVGMFSAAFFFSMWLAGLYLATQKRLGDEHRFDGLSDKVDRIASKMPERQEVISAIENAALGRASRSISGKDLLVVVDVQRDFCAGGVLQAHDTESLIEPLNSLVKRAEENGHLVVFTRDWHPGDHPSFTSTGGPFPPHCIQGEDGAKFHADLYLPADPTIINIGTDPASLGYSAFEDPRMVKLAQEPSIRNVYVVGIALEYCVLATCLGALKYGKPVIALEPYIRAATNDATILQDRWDGLTRKGVIQANRMSGC